MYYNECNNTTNTLNPTSLILPQYNVNMNQVGGLQPATILSEPYCTSAHKYGVIAQRWTDANPNIFGLIKRMRQYNLNMQLSSRMSSPCLIYI